MPVALKVPEPRQPNIVQPGEEEKSLVSGYLDQSKQTQERVAPIQQQMDKLGGEIGQIQPPPPPQIQKVPEYQPKQLDSGELFNFAGIAIGLAALASRAVKGDIALALNTAGEAMKGFSAGNLEQAKQNIAQFNTKMQSVIAQNNQQMQEYDRVMADRKLTLNQKMQQMSVLAHKFQDEIAIASLRQGDIKFLLDRQDKLRTANNNLEMKRLQMQQNFDIKMLMAMIARDRATQGTIKPIFVKDPQGNLSEIIPKYDESGKLANLPAGYKLVGTQAGSSSFGGALNARFAFNIVESAGQASRDLVNVASMPANTVLGSLAGMTGQSGETLVTALSHTMARQVTNADARELQQLVSGLEMNMGRALGGGYAQSSAAHIIDAYKKQIPSQGDSAASIPLFLARVKQEMGILAENFKNHPGANEHSTDQMNQYMHEIDQVVPYDVQDVLKAQRRGRHTISDQFRRLATTPVESRLPTQGARKQRPADAPPDAKEAPDGNWYAPDPDRPGKFLLYE